MSNKKHFGLIGKNLSHSLSKNYFDNEYHKKYTCLSEYQNYEIPKIDEFRNFVSSHHIEGLNVTIPYKETVLPFLDELSDEATEIGAVNTIKISYSAQDKPFFKGFNTDALGFEQSIENQLHKHKNALIFGTGGASKAVAYVLRTHNINITFVSRTLKSNNTITYAELTKEIIFANTLIINATPIGTNGFEKKEIPLPQDSIGAKHLCYDLVYNPSKTLFLQNSEQQGAIIQNGLEMLHLQAEASWKIWNN